jgi:hypothetical protein
LCDENGALAKGMCVCLARGQTRHIEEQENYGIY